MKAVSEFDQYNIERLPEALLHGILAQVSFHDRLVVMPLVSSDWAKALADREDQIAQSFLQLVNVLCQDMFCRRSIQIDLEHKWRPLLWSDVGR
ncbi:hypothetical protein WJX79_003728 [Trebouxia sp. C0005]